MTIQAETCYVSVECKLKVVVYACEHCQTYLYAQPFKKETDHKPLELIAHKKPDNCTPDVQRCTSDYHHMMWQTDIDQAMKLILLMHYPGSHVLSIKMRSQWDIHADHITLSDIQLAQVYMDTCSCLYCQLYTSLPQMHDLMHRYFPRWPENTGTWGRNFHLKVTIIKGFLYCHSNAP